MMHNIIPTLLTLTFVVGLAAACSGPIDEGLDSNASAAASKSRKNTCDAPSDGSAAEAAPGTNDNGGPGSSDYLTCWCNTEQGTGDGSGCYLTVTGPGCAGECECENICGALED